MNVFTHQEILSIQEENKKLKQENEDLKDALRAFTDAVEGLSFEVQIINEYVIEAKKDGLQ